MHCLFTTDGLMNQTSPGAKSRVFIVEDHLIFREQLSQLINQQTDMVVSGEADNIADSIAPLERGGADIVLLDITLKGPGGFDLLKELKTRRIKIPVLILTMHDELLYAERAVRAGARGYITKNENSARVLAAIRQVANGQVYLTKRTASRICETLAGRASEAQGVDKLTDRELEIFGLIGEGRGTREISCRLHLGISTVETYRARIKEKLNLDSASQLTHEAIQWRNQVSAKDPA
jgi:DNA-binding NarL/FixJ family response regulator